MRASSLNQSRYRTIPWAASESVTVPNEALAGIVTRSGGPGGAEEHAKAPAAKAASRTPTTPRRSSPIGAPSPATLQECLQQHGCRKAIDILLATSGAAALLANGAERSGRAHALVDQ